MEKSRDAFRTISEVAGWLDVPTHVLRFWESRFSQIKPVKRAGGRRYYRPSDMALIGGIKTLLHDQGMTIRGVQKLLREQGIKHVSTFSPPLHADELSESPGQLIEGTATPLDAPKRPISIPAPVARATRTAEPTAEEGVAEALSPDETDDAQPDMFSDDVSTETDGNQQKHAEDVDDTSAEPTPVFEHAARTEPEAPEPERPAIPETPTVPDTDPADDDETYVATASILPALFSARGRGALISHAERIGEIEHRLRDLRSRMGE